MRYIAFDVGSKRIGVAYSDESGEFAFADSVIANNTELFNQIFSICEKYQPSAFVVGSSESGTDRDNTIQKAITKFAKEIESRFGLPVHLINEHGTSTAVRALNNQMRGQKHDQASKRHIKENMTVDASAAAFILQRFLETQKNPKVAK